MANTSNYLRFKNNKSLCCTWSFGLWRKNWEPVTQILERLEYMTVLWRKAKQPGWKCCSCLLQRSWSWQWVSRGPSVTQAQDNGESEDNSQNCWRSHPSKMDLHTCSGAHKQANRMEKTAKRWIRIQSSASVLLDCQWGSCASQPCARWLRQFLSSKDKTVLMFMKHILSTLMKHNVFCSWDESTVCE